MAMFRTRSRRPSSPDKPPRRASAAPGAGSPLHTGVGVGRYVATHMLAGVFPLTAGVMLFGWRAAGVVALVMASAGVGIVAWRSVGKRGGQLRPAATIWFALLLGLMLPPHLTTGAALPGSTNLAGPSWAVLMAAGILLVATTWMLGGVGGGRVHPVLVTYLLLCALVGSALVPHNVLRRDHAALGDVLNAVPPASWPAPLPWALSRPATPREAQGDAIHVPVPAAQELESLTTRRGSGGQNWLPLNVVLRDRMPPLEDLIIGGQPAPTGLACAAGVIIGGLFLAYRGLIDGRIPLLVLASAYIALLVLPVPAGAGDMPDFRWFAARQSVLGWQADLTFVHYELLASPIIFVALFLATSPNVRPLERRARVIFAVLVGLLAAALQLYVSISFGPYLALLLVSLLTPTLDRQVVPRPLV